MPNNSKIINLELFSANKMHVLFITNIITSKAHINQETFRVLNMR